MAEQEIVILVQDLQKKYQLGGIGSGTLQRDLQSFLARLRKKEDPNTLIGRKNLKKQDFYAINQISFEIYKGERVGIIGKNGAGKSTLFKLLSRITYPTAGRICLKGKISAMLEVGTGFHRELTGRENIYLNGAILGMTKQEVDEKLESIIEFSECKEFIDTPVKRYSSGMYVKLAFAVAAHLDSEILLMDEVLAVGDVHFQQKCLAKMEEISKSEKRTILYVSHNMQTIKQLCNRCIVLDGGQIIFDGEVEKGIGKYLGTTMKKRREYVLKDCTRPKNITGMVQLLAIDILNEEDIYFGEKLRFRLKFQLNSILSGGIHLRFTIFSSNGTLVGTALSVLLNDGKVKERTEVVLQVNTSNLAPGDYYADLAIVEPFHEKQTRHDVVERAMGFTIVGKIEKPYRINWSNKRWGDVVLDNIELIVE